MKHPQAWYYVLLACAIALEFAGTNALLIATGREGVWTQDAQPLYANFLVWACQALADACDAARAGRGFALPMYTYSMGYGADVPMTMGSYLQDPINIIVALTPAKLIGVSYPLMTLARMVGAGMAFSWYCFNRGQGRKATFVASLAYATCGFILFLGAFRHPKFIDWAITLPLILQGVDRLFERRRALFFIVALATQFFVSIYYSYMSCIVVLAYCLVKYFAVRPKRSVGDFARLVGTFAACGAVAFLVSGVFSMPQIAALLSQGRATSGGTSIPVLFTAKYYAKVAAHFIGAAGTTDGMAQNAVTTIGVIVFLACGKRFQRPQRRAWLVGLAICFGGVLVPYLGHIMNGMGYATDRWMLVLAFVCCYILCMALPQLRNLDAADWKRVRTGVVAVGGLTAVYGIAQIAMPDGIEGTVWPLCMTAVFAAAFFAIRHVARAGFCTPAYALAAGMVVVCVSLSATFYLSPFGQNWGSTFPSKGTTWNNITYNSPAAILDDITAGNTALEADASDGRYTLPRVYNSMKNSALAHNALGVDYYTSFYNQRVDDFRQELGISDHHMNFSFVGSDSRLAVEDATGVRYYVAKSRDEWRVPYGFSDTGIEHEGFRLYENATTVPLAYLAPGVMGADEYAQLSMVQKQEALLQAAVVDESALETLQANVSPVFSSREIPYTIVETDGLEASDGLVRATKSNATMTLSFRGLSSSETYLCLEKLSYRGFSPSEKAELNGSGASPKTRISDLFWSESTTYPITATSGERSKAIDPATPRHLRYGGKENWVSNLCYSEAPLTEMTITFQEPGEYAFQTMSVVCQPVQPVVANAHALADLALQNVELTNNRIDATAHLADDQAHLAVFTFAYTPGWSATVDGQPADVLVTDTAFMGVEVQGAGEHRIELAYETPGVRTGTAMSIAGVAALVMLLLGKSLIARRRTTERV